MKAYSSAMSWIHGFSTKKAYFPEPWKSFPAGVLSDSCFVCSAGRKMGIALPRMYEEMKSGKHSFGYIAPATVLLEYHSSSGNVRFYRYDAMERVLQAATVTLSGESPVEANPIVYGDRSSGSGTPAFMVVALGETIMLSRADGHSPSPVKMAKAFSAPPSEATVVDWAEAADSMYNLTKEDGYINGIGTDKYLSKLSVDDIITDAKKSKPLTYNNVGFESGLRAGTTSTDEAAAAKTVLGLINSGTEEAPVLLKSSVSMADFEPSMMDEDVEDGSEERIKKLMDLRDELKLDIHELTDAERDMVPKMDPNYVPPEELIEAARDIKRDWKYPGLGLAPNFILEGDAGSGKTSASIFWAYVFDVPRTKMTMNPTFESANLIGAFYPVFRDIEDWNLTKSDMSVIKKVKELVEKEEFTGHYTPGSKDLLTAIRRSLAAPEVRSLICESYDIPTRAEVAFDPEDAWARLGKRSECPDEDEVVAAVETAIEDKVYRLAGIMNEQADKGSVSYQFVMSELLKAFQNGWLVEIQEAASVLRPGVLTELNSLLEPDGRIELPNGTCIHRHPDTIVVITTNRGYAGNVELNESLRDRCMFGLKMDSPSAAEMAKRAMARTGMTDYTVALEAAKVMKAIESEAKSRCIKGSFGMRSLLAWMLDLKRGDMSEATFMRRVVYKMTTDDDDVETLRTAFRANAKFATKTTRGKAAGI